MREAEVRVGEGREDVGGDERAGEPGLHGGQNKPDQIVSNNGLYGIFRLFSAG